MSQLLKKPALLLSAVLMIGVCPGPTGAVAADIATPVGRDGVSVSHGPLNRVGRTFSSLDLGEPQEEVLPGGTVDLKDADLATAIALYERVSNRSVIPGERLPGPHLTYRIATALPRRELLQALDTLLSQHGITMILMGTNFVKAVSEADAAREAAPEVTLPASQLPDSNSYIQYVVRLQHRSVNSAIPVVQPLARLPNSLMTIPSGNTIVIRDYSANVRRMVSVLQRLDVPDTGDLPGDPARRLGR